MDKSKLSLIVVVISLLLLHLGGSFMLPFTYWPEMFNWPFFIISGWLPYKDVAIVHTPLLIILLTGIYQLFGITPLVLHSFGTILLLGSNFLVLSFIFLKTKKLFPVVLSGLVFILLTFALQGNTVWFESLLTPIIFGIYWSLVSHTLDKKRWKIVFAGALVGLALLTKQTFVYLLPIFVVYFAVVFIKSGGLKFNRVGLLISFLAPIFILLTFASGLLWYLNIFHDFLNWGVKFVFFKPFIGKSVDHFLLLPHFKQILAISPLIIVPTILFFQKKSFEVFLALLFVFFTTLFAFPRFGYFHLVPMVPFIAVIVGLSLESVNLKKILLALFILASGFLILVKNSQYTMTFLESDVLNSAELIKRDYAGKSVFLLNGPDQIYYLSNKLPAVKPWIPQLPWYLEYYGSHFLSDIILSKPDVIVYYPYFDKPIDGLGAYRPAKVLDFIESNYIEIERLDNGVKILRRI